ncbi:TlyA family RNA methyltransferase [Caulobacter mirabilis]|uniref:TlyA family rRNA (Cytidine-2'-O)-methyltransferase n=1 Tax=Caulobacter mirabilis TaxID=69666 RepID=A0A2D2AZR1_9CAUL|nr:TlyA family RNA methyltransferase [Caulobacter mirabilis]ATQ43498.1 TlyA family rRNA (cytidine-2'-O)-methyltransferase [Caulobacter mirabilis]
MSRKRIDLILVERGLFDSRAKARAAIEAGRVTADGKVVGKASEAVDEAAEINAEAAHPWVGRGGLKLDHALTLWPVEVAGRVVLDVGASTGGFTQVVLSRGAAKVYAVDVGAGQLHPSLASDPRVVELSGTDARILDASLVPEAPDLIVTDVSFISLAKALPAALALARPGAELVALVKPQFEVGRDNVGKGGIVKDEAARIQALADVAAWLECIGWTVLATADSPVAGGDGNREFLLRARNDRSPSSRGTSAS